MRPAFEIVRLHQGSSLRCQRITGECFSPVWHIHPEIELFFVERSRGTRFVGDSVAPFREGDLILVGPELPHALVNESLPRRPRHDHSILIFIQFQEDFLGRDLWRLPEFSEAGELLRRSRHGVHFFGSTARRAGERIQRISRQIGIERVTEVLALLVFLAHSRQQRLLSTAGYMPRPAQSDAAPLAAARRYVHAHYMGRISVRAAAAAARINSASFSVFFHRKCGRTFTHYVNELRVAHAIRLIMEGQCSITRAAFASGFNNLSHFNERFRAIKGMSPSEYLRHFHANDRIGLGWLVRENWIFR